MTALEPDATSALCDDARRLAARIDAHYQALFEVGYTARVGGRRGPGSDLEPDLSRLLASTDELRDRLVGACGLVARAVACLTGADHALAELDRLVDRGADDLLPEPSEQRQRERDRIPDAQFVDAVDAQRRRDSRGEGTALAPGEAGPYRRRVESAQRRTAR